MEVCSADLSLRSTNHVCTKKKEDGDIKMMQAQELYPMAFCVFMGMLCIAYDSNIQTLFLTETIKLTMITKSYFRVTVKTPLTNPEAFPNFQ